MPTVVALLRVSVVVERQEAKLKEGETGAPIVEEIGLDKPKKLRACSRGKR